MGGVPLSGLDMGTSVNMEALYKMVDTFDIYSGGMLDMSFLSFAQVDQFGNINVSKFGSQITGSGGFVNISQNTLVICFSAIFTVGEIDCDISDGKLNIKKDGSGIKFIKLLDQITFSGKTPSATVRTSRLSLSEPCLGSHPRGLCWWKSSPE